MRSTQQLSITLPIEMAEMVDAKVKSGDYASTSEVIRAGLRALAERDSAVERWIREVVVPRFDAHDRSPEPTYTSEEVRQSIAKRLAKFA